MARAMSWFTMLGVIIGAVVGTFGGVYWVSWYNTPGDNHTAQAALCPCAENARASAETLIGWQIACAVLGLIILNFVGMSVRKRFARRAAARAAAVSPPTV
jgi:MFS family permease